jgi:hypothetical protein
LTGLCKRCKFSSEAKIEGLSQFTSEIRGE